MDRRQALEEAFDKLESDDDDVVTTEVPANETHEEGTQGVEGEGKSEPGAEAPQGVEAGKSGKKEEKVPSAEPAADGKKGAQKTEKTDDALNRAAQAAAGNQPEVGKAPVSWKPAAKAAWDKLPVDVRQDVLRREQEINKYISQNDHHRKFTEGFGNVVRPFMPLIQAQGSTPLQAVRNMMVTAAGLTTGSEEQKARIVAEIIGNYKVSVEVLDKILSDGGVPASRGNASIDPTIMQALQPVYGFMNEVQQAREAKRQRQVAEAESLIEQNADKPFFDDLSDDMADIMEIAAKRGQELTLDQAYEKALALNPEISKIVAQQKAAEEARANGGTRLAKARRASSTLTGAPSGSPDGKGKATTRREALEAAWDEHATH